LAVTSEVHEIVKAKALLPKILLEIKGFGNGSEAVVLDFYLVNQDLPPDPKKKKDSQLRNSINIFNSLGVDQMNRLKKIKEMLIASFEPALKSVREAVAQTNRDNLFLLVVNFLGGKKLQKSLKIDAHD